MEHALQAQHVLNNQFVEFAAYQLLEEYQGGLRDTITIVVAPFEIQGFFELVNKARVVEECAKKVAVVRDPRGGNNNKGRGKYIQPRGQNFKRGVQAPQLPQCQGNIRRPIYDHFQLEIGRIGCFIYGFPGHMARDYTHWRNPNVGRNQQQGRVFAVDASDAAKADPLMRGICLIGYKILTAVTRSGCRQISFMVEDREFVHNLICLPMVGLEMILGFDCKKECQGYMLLAANTLGDEQRLDQILVVREFPEVFSEDIPKFLPQRVIEFAIDLVLGAGPMSITLYLVALIELAELKAQLEELLNKRFIRPSVSP
ncbi:uncharacterized protein LOC107484199 [Arachis duranensis]|uniref:Uncharacterized protein LOC107484199 n=1 Tax=Arachis duranensis TaxID=130453 RepID=A0A6P5NMW9_ARADU|nr:uncharacterized protein LOC107484199 [Arachis duranensis]